MSPHLHPAPHLPSTPFSHGSVTISPSWRGSKLCLLQVLKCRAYADRSTPEHYSCLPSSTLDMQNQPNKFFSYSYHRKSSGSHHSKSTSGNAIAPADVLPVSADARVPVYSTYSFGWPSAVVPVVGGSGNPPIAFSDTAEKFPRVSRPRAAWEYTPPASFMNCDYSLNARQRPWISTAEAEHTNPSAPQTDWEQSHLTGMQPNRSQVPSDTNFCGGAWSHHAGDGHAVVAPAQHASLFETDCASCDIPAPPYAPTSSNNSTGRADTGLDDVRLRMAPSLPGRTPSLSHHRQRYRRPHPRPDRVVCGQCQKQMRPESLNRHVKEVHNRIKRHAKSGFRTAS